MRSLGCVAIGCCESRDQLKCGVVGVDMAKSLLASIGAILVASELALGQAPTAPSEPLPAPSDLPNQPHVTDSLDRAAPNVFATNDQCNFRELSVGLDYLLSFFPKSHESSVIA